MSNYAVHFMGLDFRPQNGTEKPWKIGETRTIEGNLELCRRGYHWSSSWEAAMLGGFLYGPMACIVEVESDGPRDAHKGVSATRRLVEAYDVTKPMRLFASDEATRALRRWEKRSGKRADKRSWAAVKAAREHAAGIITDNHLAAAQAAARAAAWAAAQAAAQDAAQAAAWAAAWVAARAAARAANAKRFATAMHEATGWRYEA